jgi:eukaryotic-like serine/threonine-protein kinase
MRLGRPPGRSADPDRTRVALVDPLIGSVVANHYRLEIGIAAGGFGAIYQALDLRTDRDVALKLLHPGLTQDPAVLARFRREGGALSQLHSSHTVAAYEVGETEDGTLYIAMELLQGENLYETFKALGPLPWRRVATIARAVCSSLSEAHALGIVHRDLKPANIHLQEHDDVKVLDFGIAKIIRGESGLDTADLTQAGHMIGTFDYMAPEQMVGGECTGQTDIFTLGVVIYEMVAGVRPYGAHDTATAQLAALLTQIPPPLSSRGAMVPFELDRIVARCLARRPEDRYASIDHVARELDTLLGVDEERTRVAVGAPVVATTDRMDAMDADSLSDAITTPPVTSDDVVITPPNSLTDVIASQPGLSLTDVIDAPRAPTDDTWIGSLPDVTKPQRPAKKFLSSTTEPGIIAPKKKR